jgi:hypothetical protein
VKKIVLLLLCMLPYSAHAICEYEHREWQSHLAAYERAQIAAAAGSVVGTLLTLPAFGIGGLILGGSGAAAAQHHDHLAKVFKKRYELCVEEYARVEAQRLGQDAKLKQNTSYARLKAIENGIPVVENSKRVEINYATRLATEALKAFITGLSNEGTDITDPAVLEYIEAERISIDKQLQEFINTKLEAEYQRVKAILGSDTEIITPPEGCCEDCEKNHYYYKPFYREEYVDFHIEFRPTLSRSFK